MAAIRNAVNYNSSHQRQIDEVTLCEPKGGGDGEIGLRNDRERSGNGILRFCSLPRIHILLVGIIVFILLIGVGHVMHIQTSTSGAVDAKLYLNLTQQMHNEMKLIRESLTRNDYKDPQAVCPSNLYTVVGPPGFWSSCYLIGGEGQLDWQAARQFCKDKGGDLVAIESEIEDKFLGTEIRKLSHSFSYWIGGSDGGKEGDWFWVWNNQKINYSHWSYNAPNNKNGIEDCMSLTNSHWDDLPCSTVQPVICEAKVPSAAAQVKPHIFVKPLTICPLSADFENEKTSTPTPTPTPSLSSTPPPRPTRTTHSNRHGRAISLLKLDSTTTTTSAATLTDYGNANSTSKSCYLYMDNKMSWRAAQEFCEANGGFLAAIESEKENDFLHKNLKSFASKDSNWWIGGNDFEKGEGNWIWTSSKIRLEAGFQDWSMNQPDNGGTYGNHAVDANCLTLNRRWGRVQHKWDDRRCGLWRPSICEVPNPYYNGTQALEFSHNIEDYVSESLCLSDKGTAECVNGTWTCYTFVRLQKTWAQAKEFCAGRGMVLAGFDSREKADAVYEKAKRLVLVSNAYYWLGASDAEKEGDWRWVKNNEPASVNDRSMAFSSVPVPPVGAPGLNCLRMEVKSYRSRMHWNDADCNDWSWFVCEKNNCKKQDEG